MLAYTDLHLFMLDDIISSLKMNECFQDRQTDILYRLGGLSAETSAPFCTLPHELRIIDIFLRAIENHVFFKMLIFSS